MPYRPLSQRTFLVQLLPSQWPITGTTAFPAAYFTVNLNDCQSRLLTQNINTLRAAVRNAKQLTPSHIDARVVPHDNIHFLWTHPEDHTNYSRRWNAIKINFSRHIPHIETRSASCAPKRERGIWQHRFWEHTIRGDLDYAKITSLLIILEARKKARNTNTRRDPVCASPKLL